MLRDPALTKAIAGHAPGKRPAEGPFEIVAQRGNSVDLVEMSSGRERKEVHAETLIYLDGEVADYERRRVLRAKRGDIPEPSAEGERPSFGELMERRDRSPAEKAVVPPALVPASAERTRARLREVALGRHVAYSGEVPKRCRVGQITAIDNDAQLLTVHVHAARRWTFARAMGARVRHRRRWGAEADA